MVDLQKLAKQKNKYILNREDLKKVSEAIAASPKAKSMTFGQLFGKKDKKK